MKIGEDTPVVVAGGGSGLGAAVAAHFAALGAPVGVIDINTTSVPDSIASVSAYITDHQSVAAALTTVRGINGQERICVNRAGIAPAAKTVSRGAAHDPALFAKVINVNLIGTFHVASQSALGMTAADPMQGEERGVIINTASIAAFEGQMGQIAYAASKGAIASMTLPMARDLAKSSIRVMAIAPGIFLTPMVGGMPQDLQDALGQVAEFPKRLGDTLEFAHLVAAIVENPMLNGSTIRLDAAARLQSV